MVLQSNNFKDLLLERGRKGEKGLCVCEEQVVSFLVTPDDNFHGDGILGRGPLEPPKVGVWGADNLRGFVSPGLKTVAPLLMP